MSTTFFNKACFVEFPRVIEDLQCPHPLEKELPYEVVRTLSMPFIDYENFAADMVADRTFIGENARLCSLGETVKCLLVKADERMDGILVLPCEDRPDYVHYAAYIPDIRYGTPPPSASSGGDAHNAEMSAILASGISPRNEAEEKLIGSLRPGLYLHYKGSRYRLFTLARHSETEELMAVYQPLYGERELWVRPAEMFDEAVAAGGRTVKRFERVGD